MAKSAVGRLALLLLLCNAVLSGAQKLGSYNVDPSKVTVSGLSAGAYMAVQLHVAYSSTFHGVASIAGGPYYCAQGSVSNALTSCMSSPSMIRLPSLLDYTSESEASGAIDPLSNLADDPVYVYSGVHDSTVERGCSELLIEYYESFLPSEQILAEFSVESGHAMITDFYGKECDTSATPYINNCGYDQAGVLLQHLYNSSLVDRVSFVSENLLRFDQTEFNVGKSMDNVGFVYVPFSCSSGNGSPCALHVALHGCLQNWDEFSVGEKYVSYSGYNEWAEANGIIILYPQAQPNTMLGNANACFDWWGYEDPDYAVKSGVQMAGIKAMVDRIIGDWNGGVPPPGQVTVTNVSDDTISLSWDPVEEAEGYSVLRNGVRANVAELFDPFFTDAGLASGTLYTYTVVSIAVGGGSSVPSEPVSATTTGTPPPLAQVQGLAVTRVTSTLIGIEWLPVSGAAQYAVHRDGVAVANVSVVTFEDSGLLPDTEYTYVVNAVDSLGADGPPSSVRNLFLFVLSNMKA